MAEQLIYEMNNMNNEESYIDAVEENEGKNDTKKMIKDSENLKKKKSNTYLIYLNEN